MTEEQIIKLKNIGIDITIGKNEREYKNKLELAKKALSEGIVISYSNKFYQSVNLYDWYNNNRDRFSQDELKIMQKLISNNKRPVLIISVENGKIYTYPSMSEAGRALNKKFHITNSDKSGCSIIYNRLNGHTKNPIYKGRFRFEYVN